MTTTAQLKQTIRILLNSQTLGVLATLHDEQPYTSLMAFAVTPDLRSIVFSTYRATRKHANLLANPRASLLIDNRTNEPADYHDAVAISAQGKVGEIDVARYTELLRLYLSKQPALENFVYNADCVVLQLEVERYYVVSQFQSVAELRIP